MPEQSYQACRLLSSKAALHYNGLASQRTTQAEETLNDRERPQYPTMIRDLPQEEKPRERLRSLGPGHLSNAELIAILLRTGVLGESVLNLSTRVIASFEGLPGIVRASYTDLVSIKGIGDGKACQLLAAFELSKRVASLPPDDRPSIGSARDIFNLLGPEMTVLEQEHLKVVLLDTKNHVRAVRDLYKGSVNSASVRVAELLRPALRENCPSLILVHNHPSGDPTPSPEDVLVTRRVRTSGEMMDIDVLDHVVIGSGGYVSMKEKGLGFA